MNSKERPPEGILITMMDDNDKIVEYYNSLNVMPEGEGWVLSPEIIVPYGDPKPIRTWVRKDDKEKHNEEE